MEEITSRSNALITHVRKLNASRAHRRAEGAFVCEGPKLLEEALQWGAGLSAVLVSEGTGLPTLPEGVRVAQVPADLMKSICDTGTPQGVLFLCSTPDLALPGTLTPGRYLVLDGVQDPGNVGTVWRTADAFGAEGLILLPGCADPFSPKTVRATMGACFRLPVWETDRETLKRTLDGAGIPLCATALRDDTQDVRTAGLGSAAVVIGSEGQGVSDAVLALCETTVKIPMTPRCESLNAAVAAAVVLWEMYR